MAIESGPDPSFGALGGALGVALGRSADQLTLELVEAALAGAADLGWEARTVKEGDDQSNLSALLGIGFQGSFGSIMAGSAGCRRVAWMGEILTTPGEKPVSALGRIARSPAMKLLRYPWQPFRRVPLPGPMASVKAAATLQRDLGQNLRDIDNLARVVDRVVMTSRDRQAALLARGIESKAVPFGYAAAVAGALTPADAGDRDIAIVCLARLDSSRADRRAVVREWRDREPRLELIDGAWGSSRNDLLRRAKVVLNVSRAPGNFVGWRLVLALAAGAVVVSEPMTDSHPFIPGTHFVAAPLDDLLDAARELAADAPRRRRIAAAGQALLAGDLSMANCLRRAIL
jgi:hypothetical protein